MATIEAILEDLLRIPSVSGDEKNVSLYIEQRLKEAGCTVLRHPVSKGRDMLEAKRGVSRTWVVAHMDTVPGVVDIRTDETHIYGRGACDNKGNIAGILDMLHTVPDLSCNLLFTVGEEVSLDGAEEAKKLGLIRNAKRIIVMEPTEMRVYRGQRGVASLTLRAEGAQMHSSLIEKTYDNALHQLIDLLTALRDARPSGWTAWNVGRIQGGIAGNITAPIAEAEISIRPETDEEMERFWKVVEDEERWRSLGMHISVADIVSFPPVPGSSQVPFFTEAAIFRGSAEDIVIFGAGSIADAHTGTEKIARTELKELPHELRRLILS